MAFFNNLKGNKDMEATKRAINELSTDARVLINFITAEMVNGGKEFLSYVDLSTAIGRDVRKDGYGTLNTAKKYVEKEHSILIETVTKEGIKRSADYSGTLDRTRKHIKKAAKRSLRRVLASSIKDTAMSNTDRINVNTQASLLGAVMMFTDNKSVKKLEGSVLANQSKELPTADTIKEFMK